MFYRTLKRNGALAVILAMLIAAQPKPMQNGQSAVDIVTLKSGPSLRGGIAWRELNGSLTMAVSLEWLRESNPKLAATAAAENRENRRSAWTQTRERIQERLKSSADSPQLTVFLQQESKRLSELLSDANSPELDFLWFDVAPENIAKTMKSNPDQQRIALFAWNEHLAHVETRDVGSLTKELKNKGVKLDLPPPDLSDRFAPRLQDEAEWSARLAVIEYALVKPLDFQGMGDALARTGDGQEVDLAKVLPKLIQQQLGSLLNDLSNDRQPIAKRNEAELLKPVIREAERSKIRGFRVTRLEIDAAALRVTVNSKFMAKLTAGNWVTVWNNSVTEDGTKPRPQSEAQIEKDTQLKSAIETVKLLGLGDAQMVNKAIRFGAATMAAQQTIDETFAEFRDRYVRHLDGPPLKFASVQE